MEKKEWQVLAGILKKVLCFENEPVALTRLKEHNFCKDKKVRICRAVIEAAGGKTLEVCRHNNACFGAAWHLGFHEIKDPQVLKMVRKFVVEGEKLFSSYEALDNMMAGLDKPEAAPDICFKLSPMEKAGLEPELVIFASSPEQACRLLTLSVFSRGQMPEIKIGGPTCRMSIIQPLVRKKMNISFYDYTARKISRVDKNVLLVSIPYGEVKEIAANIDRCSAGTAAIEYPQEFREFLQKRLTA